MCYSSLLCLTHSHLNAHAWTSPLMRTPGGLLIIQKCITASKTLSIQQAFSYLFKYRCYLYNIFHKIWFSRESVSTEGEASELLVFHLCSIATVIRTPTLSQKFLKVKLKIVALKLRWKFWELCFHPTCARVPRGSRAAPFLPGEAQVCHVKLPSCFQGLNGT